MSGQGNTGTSNTTYNLVSVMYHALQAAQTYQQFIQDAESAGDNDLAQFFRDVQQQDKQRAQQAEQLLSSRLSS